MYILKNALISILRNKSRNILIGVILIIIASAVSVTLAINNSSDSLIKSYEEKYDIEATIGINRENMMKEFKREDREESKSKAGEKFLEVSSISVDDVENFAKSEYVKEYYYTLSVGVNSEELEKAELSTSNSNNMPQRQDDKRQEIKNENTTSFTLKGYSSVEAMSEFIDGNYKITSGEVFEDFSSNYCIINNELATVNNLQVGDTIKVIDNTDEKKEYELIISGIYEENSEDNKMDMFSDSANTIITSSKFISEMNKNNDNLNIYVDPTFILTSKDVIEDFTNELYQKGLNENLSVKTNVDQVENATSTISNVKSFALTFLIITLIIGSVVLFVINMINIRERKYEIGVLRTIGMKKGEVCLQFILELLIISLISLIIGAVIGALISVPVSNGLLKNEISSSQSQNNSVMENFGARDFNNMNGKNFNGVLQVQEFDSINAVVDLRVLAELLGVGLLLTLVSSFASIFSIQRFSPLTILKERS